MNALVLHIVTVHVEILRAADEADFDPNSVTPGVVGFIATFLIAAAVVLIVVDMNRRVRRTRYREEIREKLAAEQAEADASAERPRDEPTA